MIVIGAVERDAESVEVTSEGAESGEGAEFSCAKDSEVKADIIIGDTRIESGESNHFVTKVEVVSDVTSPIAQTRSENINVKAEAVEQGSSQSQETTMNC